MLLKLAISCNCLPCYKDMLKLATSPLSQKLCSLLNVLGNKSVLVPYTRFEACYSSNFSCLQPRMEKVHVMD